MAAADSNSETRDRVGADWNDAACGWSRCESSVHNFLWPVSVRMAAAARLQPGMNVLDVGSGTGDMTLFAAYAVENTGSVLGIDLSVNMLNTARDRAKALGLTHVQFVQSAGDTFEATPQSFDAIVGRFSAIFFPDVQAGLRQLRPLLRPGGRACFSTWTPPDVNPAFAIPGAAMKPYMDSPPDENAPSPFRMCEPGQFANAMSEAGFADVTEEEVDLYQFAPSCEAYWRMLIEVSASFRKQYELLNEQDQQAVKQSVLEFLGKHEVNGIIRVPARARIVAGI